MFIDRLTAAVRRCRTPLVVGLDPRVNLLPAGLVPGGADLAAKAQAVRNFCCAVIDTVAALVPAVKPQMAFFEQLGPAGLQALDEVIQHARTHQLLVILDGKRSDIGSTAAAYAAAYLGPDSPWRADALTVSPYLGADTLTPFAEMATGQDAGVFVLVKTSNPGSRTIQDLLVDGRAVYEHVGQLVESLAAQSCGADGYGCVGAVVGATYPDELSRLRAQMPHTWFLVPGFGAQGAAAADVRGAFDSRGLGAVVNSSRGIIFAYQRAEYQAAAAHAWQQAVESATRDAIDQLRDDTPAGQLVTP